jgi:hypothetical protein
MVAIPNREDSEKQASSKCKPKRKFFSLIIVSAIIVILILGLETLAYVTLRIKGYSPSFLIQTDLKHNQMLDAIHRGAGVELDTIDPHLGYAHNLSFIKSKINKKNIRLIPGFIQYYNPDKNSSEAIKIVILGGSTTDGTVEWSWPEYLSMILDEKGFNVIIYNGAVAGYYSSQEMFKLIRDALPLHPNLIMSYSGINDCGYLGSHKKHYHVHPYQIKMCQYLSIGGHLSFPLFPSTLSIANKLIKKLVGSKTAINYGSTTEYTPSEHWFSNVNIMHAVSKRFNITYVSILQPTLGIGSYNSTKEELEYLQLYLKKKPKWLEKIASFYNEARIKCSEVDFCIDFTDVFSGQSSFYIDSTHQNKAGRYFLAQAIETQLLKRGLLAHSSH